MGGDIHSQIADKKGFIAKKLSATVLPDFNDTTEHKPYDRTVIWTSSDPDALSVDEQGNVMPVDGAAWINEVLYKAPYQGEKNVKITATTRDGKKVATCLVKLKFQAECLEADRNSETFDLVLTKTGRRSSLAYTWSGLEEKKFFAFVYPENRANKNIKWRSSDAGLLSVDPEGNVKAVVINEKQEVVASWINQVIGTSQYSGSTNAFVYAESSDGNLSDPVQVRLNLKVIDNTISGGSSGGGGGGGSRSIGVTAAGNIKGPAAPSGAITGTWTQAGNGKWIFASDRTYTDEWAYISNPFATGDQEKASWFRFDKDGFMVTGWQTDADGNIFYLKTDTDGTQGQMLTGWQNIEGAWYYLNPVSDGTRGKVMTGTVIDGQYEVNEKGQWVKDGKVVTAMQ